MTSTSTKHSLLSPTGQWPPGQCQQITENSLGAVSGLAAVHPIQLNTVPLVVTVQGGLQVLRPPGAGEGLGDVPAHAGLAQEQLVQRAARVVPGAVQALGLRLFKPEIIKRLNLC